MISFNSIGLNIISGFQPNAGWGMNTFIQNAADFIGVGGSMKNNISTAGTLF